jgi:hypothetical protein
MNTAQQIVKTVLDDLKGRKGIGNELEAIGEDIMASIEGTLERKVQKVLDGAPKITVPRAGAAQ